MFEKILDAGIRLIETLNSKNETKVLGPLYLKEILFQILTGENGEITQRAYEQQPGILPDSKGNQQYS